MNNEFIPIELEKELFELGLEHRVCVCKIYKGIPVKEVVEDWYVGILYQQAFRWFRENYNLLGGVYSNASGWLWEIHDNIGGTHRFGCDYEGDCEHSGTYTSFDKAEIACLKKLIEIAKNK